MRVISLKEVEEKKLLSKFSPIFLLAKRLSLKYIIQEGKIFTGPAVEMASLIDRITSKFEIKKVLDLCSGTGALAKICLINGCEKVTCVDLNIRVAERNLEEFGERVELVEKDVRDFEPKEFYDLVILDSPRELKEIVSHRAKVVRDGGLKIIDAGDVVVGDIFLLQPGDMVPADARILESKGLKVNEMALTGEWLPTEKHAESLELKTPIANRDNMVYMGTIVEDGRGKAIATAIGQKTEIGKIALTVKETKEQKTPYQKKLSHFSRLVGIFIVLASIFIFIEGILTGGKLMDMFITSVAVAIAAIPEGLPVAMTVILALGMQKILSKKGLTRKLVAAETLGSTSVICTDKTATLTEGKIKVSKMFTDRKNRFLIYQAAALANEAFIENENKKQEKWLIRGAPTDKALLSFGLENGFAPVELNKEYKKIDELLFDSQRKYLAKLYQKIIFFQNILHHQFSINLIFHHKTLYNY